MSQPVIDPSQYSVLLEEKKNALSEQFSAFALPAIEVFASPDTAYRMRVEFRVWHDKDQLDYVMFTPGSNHEHTKVTQCPMASEIIQQHMFVLLELIKAEDILRRKLFQIDFLSTTSGELLISLLYHKAIADDWQQAAEQLQVELRKVSSAGQTVELIGRARKTKIALGRDYVIERLEIDGAPMFYQQVENSFTQPNAKVCEHMLHWALDVTKSQGGDLVELYCGNGNFSLPLARNFKHVIATEISKSSVHSAQYNIKLNQIENVSILRMSSEEFSQALQGTREFRRLKQKDIDLKNYQFSTVLVDPPRSGMDDETLKQVAKYEGIVYISCSPATLQLNLLSLCETHEIKRFAIFDQFPYTDHLEIGVFLQRKQSLV
ncbi:MAG: tRNA (uridine(54)-C5)-methyltransferase TrmA [Oceanospirillaceae bacterium]|nr:tRNA (uridine(54)-C5)-methyltransferase TrmA [Oceanospirillaceae bacterium]